MTSTHVTAHSPGWTAVTPHAAQLRGYCARLIGQHGPDADDLAQTTLLRCASYWTPAIRNTYHWMQATAKNCAIRPPASAVAEAKLTPWGDDNTKDPRAPQPAPTIEDHHSALRILHEHIRLLDYRHQQALIGLLAQETTNQLAVRLEIKPKTVKIRVYRARKALAFQLENALRP